MGKHTEEEEEEEEKRLRFQMAKHTEEKRTKMTTIAVFKRRRKTTQRDYDYIRKITNKSRNSSPPSWSNLPSELSEEINRYLPFMDQVRFRKVCKNWHSIGRVPPSKQIPFLFAWDVTTHCPNSRTCLLIDPSSCINKTYSIKPSPSIFDEHTRACASRHGWLMLYNRNLLYRHNLIPPVFYFYSPFTGQIIDGFLPVPPTTDPYYKIGASFSSVPTSSDCIMFIFLYQEGNIVIHTCRPGEKTWTTDTSHVYKFARRQCNVIYSNDNTFYCSYGYGELGTFNISTRTWTRLITDPSIWLMSGRVHTVISSGRGRGGRDEIYLFDTGLPDGNTDSYRFYKLDQSVNHQKWVKLEADISEDEAFFLGEVSLSVSKPITTEEMANHIYLYNIFTKSLESYSLRTGRNYSSSLVSSLPDGHGNGNNGDGFGVAYRKVWIEPPPI